MPASSSMAPCFESCWTECSIMLPFCAGGIGRCVMGASSFEWSTGGIASSAANSAPFLRSGLGTSDSASAFPLAGSLCWAAWELADTSSAAAGTGAPTCLKISAALGVKMAGRLFGLSETSLSINRPMTPKGVSTSCALGNAELSGPDEEPGWKGPGKRGNGKNLSLMISLVPPRSVSRWCGAKSFSRSGILSTNTNFCFCRSVRIFFTAPAIVPSPQDMLHM
mmetsp:Transcript_48009/g.112080  ORF Transcript_48009/g.112080 Transcript_48009/m.112080 type:complete len:223 (-) Transcript_48009:801-1469(-)